jgi:hypothetical protein
VGGGQGREGKSTKINNIWKSHKKIW